MTLTITILAKISLALKKKLVIENKQKYDIFEGLNNNNKKI